MRCTWLATLGLFFTIALQIMGGTSAVAFAPDPNAGSICDRAALRAARDTNVPENILLAITRTETARHGSPWPWTVNMEGDGHWFDTRAAALQFAEQRHATGSTSFDVGCFQINFHWHGDNFPSISAMFDPDLNAHYAARFLTELYEELGSWDAAVGAYHSRTERYASRYLRIYHGHLAGLGGRPEMPLHGERRAQSNGYPLLQPGDASSLGSLVPGQSSASRPLFGELP